VGEDATPSPAPSPPPGPRLYAKSRFAWIVPAPGAAGAWYGYVTAGNSVAIRGGDATRPRAGAGGRLCKSWYPVEPRGWVCDGRDATLDPADPAVVALAQDAPKTDSPWPYQYGESTGAPRYTHIPSPEEQRRTEESLDAFLERANRARGAKDDAAVAEIDKLLVGVDLAPAGTAAPELFDPGGTVREERKTIFRGSTVAYTRSFDFAGRTFVLTADHAIVPKDRVRRYLRSEFRGVHLGADVSLPIAFFRKTPRPQYTRSPEGQMVDSGKTWPVRTWVALTGNDVTVGEGKDKHRYYETREAGVFASADDATVVRATDRIPFARGDTGRRSWLDISVLSGTMVAYEADKPVFATLISPGRGGLPVDGVDPIRTASTPNGTFRVDGKFRTATMVSSTDDNLVHSEVQYVQNFHGAHALHGAYWHDAWGEMKSGGCVNLSPIDSLWLFDWTDPKVPEGWHGLRATKEFGQATVVVIHR
jgi:L,D-transpeptidase catalytic domain